MPDRETNLLRSVTETTWRFYLWTGFLLSVTLVGLIAYLQQFRHGLIVTAMRDQYSWGLYITNFVFYIGISHVGALLSAILRFSGAEWRRPLTRMAEAITFASLCVGGLMPVVDLGRPDRIMNLLRYGRIQSPLLWDVIGVTTYLTGSTLFLWALMIPDIALLRDNFPNPAPWRKRLYTWLGFRYYNTPEQRHFLEKAIMAVTVVILPLAISVHTVVSWIFAMTLRPGWDSTIFGPYFVAGALFSGAASVILAMYIFRRVYGLQDYLKPLHFRNLGFVLVALTMLYLYFNVNEYLTMGYKFAGEEKHLLERLFWGDYAMAFWGTQVMGVMVPLLLLIVVLAWRREFTIPGITAASALIVVFSWLKRYLIIIPTLGSPFLPVSQHFPAAWKRYSPSLVEWCITAGSFAAFLLIYTLLSKLFPIISIWETREAPEEAAVTAPAEAAIPAASGRWEHSFPFGVLLIVILLGSAGVAHAAGVKPPTKPETTMLKLDWQALPPAPGAGAGEEAAPGGEAKNRSRISLSLAPVGNLLFSGWAKKPVLEPPRPISVSAVLLDTQGKPLAYQAVDFSFQTLFGALSFGKRPTDAEGKVQLVLRDRRYGNGPILVSYPGDAAHAASKAEILVDMGARPAPSLPAVGVLIDPYPTAAISLSFIAFYGTIWVVFIYAFGYMLVWRMRRVPLKASVSLPRS